jgi:cell filamentation protein
MYVIEDIRYCYPHSTVLKNRANHREQEALDDFELVMVTQRFDEPLPKGRFTVRHYLSFHRHLFQDVYDWAGRIRTVRLAKDQSQFCYPEHIQQALKALFLKLPNVRQLREMQINEFAVRIAQFLAELNAIHAFREGNGRTQLAFIAALVNAGGRQLNLNALNADRFLDAMIKSFFGKDTDLVVEIRKMLE